MNDRLPLAQGASCSPTIRDGAPWCNPRCLHFDGTACVYRAGYAATKDTLCLPAVQALGHQVVALKDDRLALRAELRKARNHDL